MAGGDLDHWLKEVDLGEDLLDELGVRLHLGVLVLIEPAPLAYELGGDRQLAQIVDQADQRSVSNCVPLEAISSPIIWAKNATRSVCPLVYMSLASSVLTNPRISRCANRAAAVGVKGHVADGVDPHDENDDRFAVGNGKAAPMSPPIKPIAT